jgi:radical SAM protein with 4Fe4S-binding SPASM domain
MIVLPNGDIYPCTVFAWKEWYKMGNIFTGWSPIPQKLSHKTDFCMGCDFDKVHREVIDD